MIKVERAATVKGGRMRAGLWLMSAVFTMSNMAWGQAFNGMDRNDYPGDSMLGVLHKSFSYTGYWLNAPPGEKASSWVGRRATLRENGFGFLLLWNGRLDKELNGKDAASLGRSDAAAAVAAAAREGFPKGALIFLDQEEGGRLLQEQLNYVLSWVDAVRRAG